MTKPDLLGQQFIEKNIETKILVDCGTFYFNEFHALPCQNGKKNSLSRGSLVITKTVEEKPLNRTISRDLDLH